MSATALASILVKPFTELIGKFVTDKDKAAQIAFELSTMAETQQHAINLAQIEVNKVEAASPSVYKGGWRPFIGWTCGLAFFNNFIVGPYIEFFSDDTFPALDWTVMGPVMLGLLGLGGYRTYEKTKGVAAP